MVPTEDAKMTHQIFEVVIWSDEVTGIGSAGHMALLEKSQAGRTWSLL